MLHGVVLKNCVQVQGPLPLYKISGSMLDSVWLTVLLQRPKVGRFYPKWVGFISFFHTLFGISTWKVGLRNTFTYLLERENIWKRFLEVYYVKNFKQKLNHNFKRIFDEQ